MKLVISIIECILVQGRWEKVFLFDITVSVTASALAACDARR